jgi:hypothetical protein
MIKRQHVIEWLRGEAAKLNAAADALEDSAPIRSHSFVNPAENTLEPEDVLPRLRGRLRRGSSRVPQLAKEFGCSEAVLRGLVADKANGIVMQERGWLKLRENLNGTQ